MFRSTLRLALIGVAATGAPLSGGNAQTTRDGPLDTLVVRALAAHPAIRAATARVEAARRRVQPAGLLPDPMLMVGIQNLPLGKEADPAAAHGTPMVSDGSDPMTMRMIGVGQTIPYPGKLAARRRIALREVDAAQAALTVMTRQVIRDVKDAYYELAFIDRALEIVERNQSVLVNLIRVTEARYGVGTGGQQDVLKARVEASRLAETAVSLTEQRRATLARLNALLDRPSETAVPVAAVPPTIARAAVASSADEIRFVSAALGARAAGSPLPPLVELQETALRESPELREQEAMVAAQVARAELARREYLPDFDVSLQYGQRPGRPDMLTAIVSVPIPVWKGRKQDALTAEARAELAALEAGRAAKRNEIRAEVARLVSELERLRAQLAVYVKAVLPQSRASLASATASYQVGKVEFLTVLDDQATLFSYETEYFRGLTDFAKTLAELERVVGKEIVQ
jgi:cobalt-zinc-cadmium efflux system outer membrane protein